MDPDLKNLDDFSQNEKIKDMQKKKNRFFG